MRVHRAAVSLVALLVLAAPAGAQVGPVVKLDLKQGDLFRYALTTDQDVTMDLGPMGSQHTRSTTRFELLQTVRERREDGIHALQTVYQRVSVTSVLPGLDEPITVEVGPEGTPPKPRPDNPGPREEAEAKLRESLAPMRAMLAKPFTVVLSPQGEVLQVEGLQEILDGAWAIPEDAPPEAVEMMLQMRQGFGEDALMDMMRQATPVFPADPLAIGQSWTRRVDMDNPIVGKVGSTTTYTPQAFERRGGRPVARIGLSNAMTFPRELPLMKQLSAMMAAGGAPDLTMNLAMEPSEGTGTLVVDLASGRALRMEQAQPIRATITLSGIPAAEGQPTSMALKMSMATTIILEALD